MADYTTPVNQFLKSIDIQPYDRYLPNAFNDSLTMLEKVNKVIHQLHENSQLTNEIAEKWNNFVELVNEGDLIGSKINEFLTDDTIVNLIDSELMSDFKQEIQSTTQSAITNVNTKLSEKADINTVRFKAEKLTETDLSEELLQQMVGDTPIHSVPANGSLTKDKFSFPIVEGEKTNNLFNKETVTKGFYINPTGQLVDAPAWSVSDFMDVLPGSKVYFTSTSFSCFYDDNKNVVPGGATTITSPLTVPTNATKLKLGYKLIDLDKAMVNMGDRLLAYEKYGANLPGTSIKNSSISKDKLDFDPFSPPSTTKKEIEIIVPFNVYSVANDIGNKPVFERNYVPNLVIDHMINLNDYDKDISFKGKGHSFPFFTPFINDGTDTGFTINKGKNVNKEMLTLEFESREFNVTNKQVNHISTLASTGKTKPVFVLTIGDSLTNGHLADINRIDEVKQNQLVYWSMVRRWFELDKIDGGDNPNEYKAFMLGKKTRREIKIDYKGKSRTITANGEGYGGWSLYSILRHQDRLNGSQSTWDLLGLGNGSGSDYTGSVEQRNLIASTNQVFTGTPVNPFFDNSKTGGNRFSLTKYLERFRTMDDNGNRLTLGNGTGSEINTSNINSIDVCTPTHIVLQMGANDLGRTTPEKFLSNVQEFVATVRSQFPNIIIGISLTPDYAGTYFPSKYPEFDNCKIDRVGHGLHYNAIKLILNWFDGKNEDTEKLYLIPNYFVQPNAYSMPYIKYQHTESESDDHLKQNGYLIKYGAGPDIHPNYNAHSSWAYQIYSWLKYTLSLN